MVKSTGCPASAANSTSGKQIGLCRKGSKNRDIRLAHNQTSAVSEHAHETGHYPIWNGVKFTDRDPHWYTRRVKEAIHIRPHPNNINKDSGIEIPEKWMSTIKSATTEKGNNSVLLREQLYSPEQWDSGRIEMHQSQPTFVI